MDNLITLEQNVIKALDFFISNPPVKFNPADFQLPFVVGSGNAYNTGLILFSQTAAIFSDESNFKNLISSFKPVIKKGLIKEAIIISASGEKDSVWEIELAQKNSLRTHLLTSKPKSSASQIADKAYIFKSIAEPYTYNVSTYMGMILSAFNESAKVIKEFIDRLEFPVNFSKYEAYSFVLPDSFAHICPMLDIKKSELFGPNLALRAFSQGHARHAKFVIRDNRELVISLMDKNNFYGLPGCRWDILIPQNFGPAAMMAVTYYIIGRIQASKPSYYLNNIENYVKNYGPKAYGKNTKPFDLIVPGSEK